MQQKVMAVSGVDSVGAITYAKLTNDVPLNRLIEAWAAKGFNEKLLPSPPTGENVLRRALTSIRRGVRTLLRPLEGKNGFALVQETAKDDQLNYAIDQMLRARISHTDTETCTLTITPENHPSAKEIRDRFDALRNTISAAAFGAGWIWRYLAPKCRAVSLRDFGGVYFIPRDMMELWNDWSDTIEETCPGVKIYRIPAVSGAEALQAIMDSMRAEAETAISAINTDLLKTGSDALGKLALKNRKQRTKEVRDKVEYYENLFEISLEDLRKQLDSINTEIGGALLLLADDMDLGGNKDE